MSSPGQAAMELDVLDMAADAVIRCKDGKDIPVSLFCVLSSCSVLREMVRECGGYPKTSGGRRVVEVFLDSDTVSALISAIHSRDMGLGALPPEACQAAMLGAKALGAAREENALLDTMMDHAQADRYDPESLEYNMHFLLDSRRTRQQAARLVAKAFPRFEDAAEMLTRVAEKSHGFSHEQVKDLVPVLCRRYVPCSIFILLLGLVPKETLNASKVMEVLGGSDSLHMGSYFHPKEMSLTLQLVTAFFEANAYDPVLTRALITIASSISCYDVAPMSVASFNGSIMSFQNAAITSALVGVDGDSPRFVGRTLSPFLKIVLNRLNGQLTVRIKWAAVDTTSRRADLFKLRVSVFKVSEAYPVAEHWRTWTRKDRASIAVPWLTEANFPAPFADCLKSWDLDSIRIDLFYSPPPPMLRQEPRSPGTSQ